MSLDLLAGERTERKPRPLRVSGRASGHRRTWDLGVAEADAHATIVRGKRELRHGLRSDKGTTGVAPRSRGIFKRRVRRARSAPPALRRSWIGSVCNSSGRSSPSAVAWVVTATWL